MKAKCIFIGLALVFLSGCSVTRLAYNNADVFLRWQANHYLDFQGEQSDELDRNLAAFLGWHRKTRPRSRLVRRFLGLWPRRNHFDRL